MMVLVTGGTGFLGRRVVELLVERGQEVRVLVRPTSDGASLKALGAEVVIGRLEEPASLTAATDGVSVIYHCAALSTDWGPRDEFYAANVQGVRNLLEAAAGVDRFVHISTTDVYGYRAEAEGEDAAIRDTGLPYNRTKGLGDREVSRFHARTGLPTTILRPASIYGPRNKDWIVEVGGMLVSGSMVLIDGGRARAGLIYVDDVVEAMSRVVATDATVGKAYNLRHPADTTWREYFDRFADGIGARRPRLGLPRAAALALGFGMEAGWRVARARSRPLLTRHSVHLFSRDQGFPIDRAQRDFGFHPEVDLADGLRRSIAWLDSPEGRVALPRPSRP
jgi:nucleoside-diphosphate-sugar epimerase